MQECLSWLPALKEVGGCPRRVYAGAPGGRKSPARGSPGGRYFTDAPPQNAEALSKTQKLPRENANP